MALIHQPLEPSTSRRSPKAMLLVTWSPANDIFYEPSELPQPHCGQQGNDITSIIKRNVNIRRVVCIQCIECPTFFKECSKALTEQ